MLYSTKVQGTWSYILHAQFYLNLASRLLSTSDSGGPESCDPLVEDSFLKLRLRNILTFLPDWISRPPHHVHVQRDTGPPASTPPALRVQMSLSQSCTRMLSLQLQVFHRDIKHFNISWASSPASWNKLYTPKFCQHRKAYNYSKW